jgi:glucose-1-phosphatase
MKKVKNILFDFGGVLYDIDIQLSVDAFHRIGIFPENEFSQTNNIFIQLEKGLISPDVFLGYLQNLSTNKADIEEIKTAFMKILVGFRENSLEVLKKLASTYNLYLLSNTNIIHYEHFYREIMENNNTRMFYKLFKKEYYSFQIQMRKPDKEIFDYFCRDACVVPAETLFVDDSKENIDTAEKSGFQVFWMKENCRLLDITKNNALLV